MKKKILFFLALTSFLNFTKSISMKTIIERETMTNEDYKDKIVKKIQDADKVDLKEGVMAQFRSQNKLKESAYFKDMDPEEVKELLIDNAKNMTPQEVKDTCRTEETTFVLSTSGDIELIRRKDYDHYPIYIKKEEIEGEIVIMKTPDYGFIPNTKFSLKELQKKLTREELYITQYGMDEKKDSGIYYKFNEKGKYKCKVCDKTLLDSKDKFDTDYGFATFSYAIGDTFEQENYINKEKNMVKFNCKNCGSYLGLLVRIDGRSPTSRTYALNSQSLNFEAEVKVVN